MENILKNIAEKCRPLAERGKVATYIPELAKADPDAFAIAITEVNGQQHLCGNWKYPFSLQSISKIVTLALALTERGGEVFSYVGMDPVADPFNSIMRLEMDEPHRPHNPLINSGAIVVVSLLPQEGREGKIGAILGMCRRMAGNSDLTVNEAIYRSEKNTSDRNRALAYFLRSVGNLEGDVEDILDVYFRQCSIQVSARDLSVIAATLANNGINPVTKERVLSARICSVVRAIMSTCGMYDGSGEFAVRVGIPAKSGVGGGIMGTVPHRMGVGVCSPPLDCRGNSVAGLKAFECISQDLNCRVL